MRINFTYTLFALCAMCLTSACCNTNNEYPDAVYADDDGIVFAFTLSVQDNLQPSSRSYSTGWQTTDYDAAIDLKNIKVAIFSGDGIELEQEVSNLNCYEIAANTYQYYGKIDKDKLSTDKQYRCVVIANSNNIVDFSKLSELTYAFADLPNTDNTDGYYIPMWGMSTFTLKDGVDTQNAGNITLLRAAAKCRIHLSDDLYNEGYRLDDLTFANSYESGYVLPKNYNEISSSADYSNSTYFNPLKTDTRTTAGFVADPEVELANKSAIVYFPEFENTEADPATVSLSISNSTYNRISNFVLKFADYEPVSTSTTDNPYENLSRNHVYDFNIVGLTHGLEIELTVAEWALDVQEWDFTETITVEDDHDWVSNTYASYDKSSKTVVMLSGVVLQGTFSIKTPIGASWVAALTDDTGGDTFCFVLPETDEYGKILTDTDGDIVYKTEIVYEEDGVTPKTDSDGNVVTKLCTYQTLTGEILKTTDTPVTVYIYPLRPNTGIQQTGEFNVYVRYNSEQTRKVGVLSDWTIIQPI